MGVRRRSASGRKNRSALRGIAIAEGVIEHARCSKDQIDRKKGKG